MGFGVTTPRSTWHHSGATSLYSEQLVSVISNLFFRRLQVTSLDIGHKHYPGSFEAVTRVQKQINDARDKTPTTDRQIRTLPRKPLQTLKNPHLYKECRMGVMRLLIITGTEISMQTLQA